MLRYFDHFRAFTIITVFALHRYRQTTLNRRYDAERQIIIHDGTKPVGSLKELLDASQSMGGGSGVPLLVRLIFATIFQANFIVSVLLIVIYSANYRAFSSES